ncbi:hypothetical protein HMPREF3156_02812 [Neisseria sp. HMSC06F02]|nr:hypothetical protein HMPREF3156_02812 [Neisseria sp. HMSC06F02]
MLMKGVFRGRLNGILGFQTTFLFGFGVWTFGGYGLLGLGVNRYESAWLPRSKRSSVVGFRGVRADVSAGRLSKS